MGRREEQVNRFAGAFPGGPSRPGGVTQTTSDGPLRPIASAEDRERRARQGHQHNRVTRRRKRAVVGVGTALLLSTAAGIYWGFGASRRASEQMVDWQMESATSPEAQMSQEMDRLMTELWKMESLERVPTR